MGLKRYSKIADNFANFVKEIYLEFQDIERIQNMINSNNFTPKDILIKLLKTKEKNTEKPERIQ